MTNIYRLLTAFRLRFCLDSPALFECCLSPVPSLFVVVNTLKAGTFARPGFGGDCEALGEGPVVDTEKGLLLSSKASPATGERRWEGGRALVASTMAAASSGVTGDSEVSAAIC